MNFVQASQPFSFNYTDYDQDPSLFIAFSIYDVSTGTAVFIQKVVASYANFGAYMADYLPVNGVTYLVIGFVYTDNTYGTIDTTRAPSADTYQTVQSNLTYVAFAYATYDLQSGLNLEATIYNMSSGTPVLDSTTSLAEVIGGVYLGTFNGVLSNSYQIISVVYTDNTFTTPDLSRAPSTQEFESIKLVPNLVVGGSAILVGQSLSATLIAQ